MVLNFKRLPALLKALPYDAAARHFLEAKRWYGCPTCPFCQSNHYYKLKDGKRYRCGNKECRKDYTVTTGTFFESTKKDLHLWIAAMYLISSHKKGTSSCQLAKDINVTQRTAWFMLHSMRGVMKPKTPIKLEGIVEADETYMSRKYRTDTISSLYMASPKKKTVIPPKKKVNGSNTKTGKYTQKIKVEGTFDELLTRALNSPPNKKR